MIDLEKQYTSQGEKVLSIAYFPTNNPQKQLMATVESRSCGIHTRFFDTLGIFKGNASHKKNLKVDVPTQSQWYNVYLQPFKEEQGCFFIDGLCEYGMPVKTIKQSIMLQRDDPHLRFIKRFELKTDVKLVYPTDLLGDEKNGE